MEGITAKTNGGPVAAILRFTYALRYLDLFEQERSLKQLFA